MEKSKKDNPVGDAGSLNEGNRWCPNYVGAVSVTT